MKAIKTTLKIVLLVGAFLIANQYLGWFDLGLPIAIFAVIFGLLLTKKDGKLFKRGGRNSSSNWIGNDNDYFTNHHDHDYHDSDD